MCLAQSFFSVTHICQTFLFGRLKPALEGLGGKWGKQAVRQHFRESLVICCERCVIVFSCDPGTLLIIGQHTLNQKTTCSTVLAGWGEIGILYAFTTRRAVALLLNSVQVLYNT